jgi:hypothetical protein
MIRLFKEDPLGAACVIVVLLSTAAIIDLLCVAPESYMTTEANVNHAAIQYILPIFTAAFSALTTQWLNKNKGKKDE